MKFCTKCGQKNDEGTKFCTKCGAPMSPSQVSSAETQQLPTTSADLGANPGFTKPIPVQQQATAPAVQAGVQTPVQGAPVQEAKSGHTAIIVVAILAVVAIVVTACVVMAMNSNNADPIDANTEAKNVTTATTEAESTEEKQPATATPKQQEQLSQRYSLNEAYIIPGSNTRYLSESDLIDLDDYELYLARNEIFARHGRGFNNEDLRAYFSQMPWYQQRYTAEQFDSMPSPLNDYELKNSQLIREYEKLIGSPYVN